MSFKKVTHCIFDLDGLLMDTETLYKEIIQNIIREYGKEYTNELRMKVMGTLETVTSQIIVDELKLPITSEEFNKIVVNKILSEAHKLVILPGAERLLNHLQKHNVPLALATSASAEATEAKIKHHKILNIFHHKVMGTTDPEVKNGKPSPDIFLICASRFPNKPKPQECLVFEDAPNGVKAALAAGMQVVMVPDKNTNQDLCKQATIVLNSLEEFKPELFGLPSF